MNTTWIRLRPGTFHTDSDPVKVCQVFRDAVNDKANPFREKLCQQIYGLQNSDVTKIITEALAVARPGQPKSWSINLQTKNGIFGDRKDTLEEIFNSIADHFVAQSGG